MKGSRFLLTFLAARGERSLPPANGEAKDRICHDQHLYDPQQAPDA
jgi:hypothetical protein